MSRLIEITFLNRPDSHDIWIFSEELSLAFERAMLGVYSMADADSVVDRIVVSAIKTRNMKRALRLAEDVVAKHKFTDRAVVKHQ